MWGGKWDVISPHALSGWTVSVSKMDQYEYLLRKTASYDFFQPWCKASPFGSKPIEKADPIKYKEGRRRTQSGTQRETPWYKMDISELSAAYLYAVAQWIVHAGGLITFGMEATDPRRDDGSCGRNGSCS
ncbi:Protein of unknown function DUF3632 [Penicillium chrysogenum]|uniref:Uncharacterized protein n=1 Tax=Penicillium chrysogenum TaxID=5076 RepID=A0ABQ8WAD8_PENCH|nr:Protein of unknown function DUF3632 [Penicillium chrysogenum]